MSTPNNEKFDRSEFEGLIKEKIKERYQGPISGFNAERLRSLYNVCTNVSSRYLRIYLPDTSRPEFDELVYYLSKALHLGADIKVLVDKAGDDILYNFLQKNNLVKVAENKKEGLPHFAIFDEQITATEVTTKNGVRDYYWRLNAEAEVVYLMNTAFDIMWSEN